MIKVRALSRKRAHRALALVVLPVVLAGLLAAGCVTPLPDGTKNLVWNCQNAEKTVTVGYAVNYVAHSNNTYTVNELVMKGSDFGGTAGASIQRTDGAGELTVLANSSPVRTLQGVTGPSQLGSVTGSGFHLVIAAGGASGLLVLDCGVPLS
jgi:hypothetical protein